MMQVLRVDLGSGRSASNPLADPLLGGRAFVAETLTRELDPGVSALSGDNLLVLAGGPLAGLGITKAGRL